MDIPRLKHAALYTFFAFTTCLFFYRPNSMLVNEPLDDSFYLAKTQQMLGEEQIFLPRLGWAIGSFVAPGTSVIWLPPAIFAKSIALSRHENIQDWTWAVLSIFGFFAWAACFPLTVCLLETWPTFRGLSDFRRMLLGFLVFLNLPLVSNALGHNLSPHIYETILALLMGIALRRKRLLIGLCLCAAMTMTRFNDAPAFAMIAGAWLDRGKPLPKSPKERLAIGAVLVAAFLALWHVVMIGFVRGYGVQTIQSHMGDFSWLSLKYFFIHWGHGVAVTYCLWLVALALGLWNVKKLSWASRGGLIWMIAHIVLYAFWGGPGASMGHRYLCGTYVAVIFILAEICLQRGRFWRLLIPTALMAAWLTWLMVTFCTVLQLNYSVDFEIKDRPGVIFHPYYMDRFLQAAFFPGLYWHIYDLGLVQSVNLSLTDPYFERYGEAVLPADSVALALSRHLIKPFAWIAALAFALWIVIARRKP